MIKKPKKCCEIQKYEHTIPMPIRGRVQGIDLCISDIVAALNAANLSTIASCCGHGIYHGIINLEDGRSLVIFDDIKEALEAIKRTNNE